ncbi:MAG: hypothetical protein QME05_04670 [Candidatus Margulisbacteria bacterium]|nr:hypothetical protein [Candidatus Margulisiibacteriota bacterium]
MVNLRLGDRVDRWTTRQLTPVARKMAGSPRLGKLALISAQGARLFALGVGIRSWQYGTALQAAAEQEGFSRYVELMDHYSNVHTSFLPGSLIPQPAGYLEKGWVIANHKLVSFHAAFISSILSLPESVDGKLDTLKFMFLSAETAVSLVMLYTSWHIGIAVHELGHYVTAAKLTALNKASQASADRMKSTNFLLKAGWYARAFIDIPWGKFEGVKKEGGNFAPDAPYNLAVAAAGPRWSSYLAMTALPLATISISIGLITGNETATYIGRFLLAPGVVGLLDRMFADPGKLKEFKLREALARDAAASVRHEQASSLIDQLAELRTALTSSRFVQAITAAGLIVAAPWQWRNCAMGGRHTEKEYPESNISMQESMFIPLSAGSIEEAQEMTVRLQTRLKEIIESAAGARVMGIGLEGGLAPYVDKEGQDKVPEQRVWRMMKQAILDCGYRPGMDVGIALDPAASELENAYREEFNQPGSVGMYLFWRDKSKVVMSRDEVLELYKTAIERDDVPIVSIEDGFGERDHAGWRLLRDQMGNKIFVVGDDLVTTCDSMIEGCAKEGLINTVLIKANQIGTLSETMLAMLTSWAYGCELIISHRSKSPNDPFEAEIAAAMNALGAKWGGGANTERLQKYGRMGEILQLAETARTDEARATGNLKVHAVRGKEESTNAGIPTGAVTVFLDAAGTLRVNGAVPLGTSAGETEAIHYVDSIVEARNPLVERYSKMFKRQDDGTYRFAKGLKPAQIEEKNDAQLTALWKKAQRFGGKGCLEVVDHIDRVLAPAFVGKSLDELGRIVDIDRELLRKEREQAEQSGRLTPDAPHDAQVQAMQRKGALGMNAILSLSLALGRAAAMAQGKELWQLLRETACDTMVRFVVAHGAGNEAELRALDIDKLRMRFRETAKALIEQGREIHPLLRDILPVYAVTEEARACRLFEDPAVLSGLDEQHQAEMAVLARVFQVEGSLVYEVKIRDEDGEPKPYIRVKAGSRSGIGQQFVSRAGEVEFVPALDHKGWTVQKGDIWVDYLSPKLRGPQFTGKHIVAIPQRQSERGGVVTALIGTFREMTPQEKAETFAPLLASVKRFASDRAVNGKDEEIEAAFGQIPVHAFFELATGELYTKYIEGAIRETEQT